MTRIVLGGDPGKLGAIAAVSLEPGNPLLAAVDIPAVGKKVSIPLLAAAVNDLAAGHDVIATAVELVGARPGEARNLSFAFGVNVGLMQMALGGSWPMLQVTPAVWKRHFHIPGKDVDKDAGRQYAIQRWPDQLDLLRRVKDGGRADAALIALWCAETQPIARTVAA